MTLFDEKKIFSEKNWKKYNDFGKLLEKWIHSLLSFSPRSNFLTKMFSIQTFFLALSVQ